MWWSTAGVRIWLYADAADMRKSFDGLAALAKQELGSDPLSGHLFVFFNRRRTYVKILQFVGDGYCIWAKRLERGRFARRRGIELKQALTLTELQSLLEGVEVVSVHRRRRYVHEEKAVRMIGGGG